ncbi:PAS domain-containing protein [Bdellovibrio sp. SKB1291214]|uniref:PAS domain-containing protein n=1 Tax=Bdellovibrio sp. SKB1291214 TaxID=1732569 RepID=UPI000B51DD3E|nr:PAS domain-containing protein [Bdellovibrio sp. SKB1291214]UYL08170.1 PAS domain-containing protein [Bdellovibrio sp. SKB1291214]
MGSSGISIVDQIRNIEHVAAYMTDDQHRITVWNSNVEQLLGYNQSEIIDQSDAILLFDSSEDTTIAGAKFNWRKAKDGRKLFVLETVTKIEDPDSSRFQTMKIIEDYTDQLSFLEKIELWMQQYQEQDLILVVNQKSLSMSNLSDRFVSSLGYTQEELQGRPLETVVSEGSKSFEGTVDELIVTAKRIHGMRFKLKDESVLTATVSSFEMSEINVDGTRETYWFAKILPFENSQTKMTEYFF